MAKTEKREATRTYVGGRISDKQYKLYLSRAKVTPNAPKGTKIGERHGERAALQSFYLGEALQYFGKGSDDKSDFDKALGL